MKHEAALLLIWQSSDSSQRSQELWKESSISCLTFSRVCCARLSSIYIYIYSLVQLSIMSLYFIKHHVFSELQWEEAPQSPSSTIVKQKKGERVSAAALYDLHAPPTQQRREKRKQYVQYVLYMHHVNRGGGGDPFFVVKTKIKKINTK